MKILHLEDSPYDADLIRTYLRRDFPDAQIHTVSNREDFVAQLSSTKPDLVLSDFTLASFNGMEALAIARDQAGDVPFIFVSGTIGEDRAIEALKAGASDYIIKDRPKRLASAIKRAIRETQERRQRRAAEEQFLRAQRLENIGMLAAGIAHDFNNVLAPILLAAPLLRDRTTNPDELSILNNIERSAERGAGLVRQILGFAQGIRGAPQDFQLKHLVRDLLSVLEPTLPTNIRIESNLGRDLWTVCANPTHVHQVLMNLCVNARDAMPAGGVLHVQVENEVIDELHAAAIKHGRPGAFIRIQIEDTGTGIPPEVIERMWEPFFTTKAVGHGTGLGLSTVRGIVEEHHGFIHVDTEVGRGTRFDVYLPATRGASAVAEPARHTAVPRGHGELILVVDDDPNVRDVTAATLVHNGYKVLVAQDGTDGLAQFVSKILEVRLIVTDIKMPNLDGIALAKIVRGLSPTTRILTITGVADENDRAEAARLSGAVLTKPFSSSQLLIAIDQLLTAPAPALPPAPA